MANAEKHQLLHPHQYGSRKGKMCISAVLLKRISYDHIRQTRTDAIMFDNDASACYDRIIPSLAAMMSRHAGMTWGWNGSHVLRFEFCSIWNITFGPHTALPVSHSRISRRHARCRTLGNTVGTNEQHYPWHYG